MIAPGNIFETAPAEESTRAAIAATLADFYREELGGTKKKPAPKFSIARALLKMRDGGLDDGFEQEVCGAAAMIAGGKHDRNRVVVPLAAIAPRRDLTVASPSGGGYLHGVATTAAVDILRPWSVTARAGLTVFENLRENVAIPRDATAPSGTWLTSEGGAIVEATPVLGSAAMAPKVFGVLTEFSLKFLRQVEGAEQYVRTRLLRAAAHALDQAVLNGAGSSEPIGILNHASVASESGSSFAWANALNIQETLANAGLDDTTVTWVGAPGVRKLLQGREVVSGSGRFIWSDDKVVNRAAYATSDMPSGSPSRSARLPSAVRKSWEGLWLTASRPYPPRKISAQCASRRPDPDPWS